MPTRFEILKKQREDLLAGKIPGRTYTPDFVGSAMARTGFTPEPIPNTSTFTPETPAQQPPADSSKTNTEQKGKWINPILTGLTGAAYGAQADVGAPIAGQQWTQGLLKGLIGTGMAAAAERRIDAERNKQQLDFSEKMALLNTKISGAPTEEDKFADYEKRMALRQANTLEAIRARNAGAVKRAKEIADLEKASGWSQKDLARLKVDLIGKVNQTTITDPIAKDIWVETHYQDLLTGLGQFKVPQR